ncbi:ABC transporter substrate-binding protein [Pleurocapsa sp. CCALA 161]|uniref:transporter substrate-binding domain-containing protein n=1 Tax=Pleurocapsa sp. CCALA 161 TaxID=2107688 RepID=UPI000D06A06D|nr:transporter substrate-binding domain-containing protein [Pleurocapsa sp. CCALA 161]PSB12267.1 ABC transporter substrate-binding protein [Pleurocapsa sp. CCALA 161]
MKYRLLHLITALSSISLAIASQTITPKSVAAREWSEIASQGELKVAVKNNLRPLGFTKENGNLVGLEIDIAHQLAAELLNDPKAIELIPVDNVERSQVVLKDEVDIAIARVAVTTPRSRIVDFSPYYYLDGTGIVTKNQQIKNINSLPLKRIAVLNHSATIAVIQYRLPNAALIGVDSYTAALKLMESNQVDAFAGDRSILSGLTQEYPDYHLLPERLSGEALAVVMPKGLQYQELRTKVNRAIARWKQSGWLQDRIEYWGL